MADPSTRPRRLLSLGLLGLLACSSPGAGGDGHDDAAPGDASGSGRDAPGQRVTFPPSAAPLVNPERGFYTTTQLTAPGDLSGVRAAGMTLVYASVHLDAYLGTNHEQDLPAQVLDDVTAGFAAVRAAGLKAVVRFQYDDGEGYPTGANDASEATMVRHIQQLAPVLAANEDVLFVLQAGFIGCWGEWHTSLNFVDGPGGKEPRQRVVEALLAAAPATRRVALRYPAYKRMFDGVDAASLADVQGGTARGRTAHLNDCFLSSDDDVGTYQYEPPDTLRAYLEQDTAYVPIGGETCALHPRSECPSALAEMARFHWTYLNSQYHPDVLARWDQEGCRPAIANRLGYRLALSSGTLPAAVRPGGTFRVELALSNDGFAAPTNARLVRVVLEGQGQRLDAALDIDVRTWLPGEHTVSARLRVPSNLAEGSYRLALWLPDAADRLRDRAEYAVQLANDGAWVAATGDNTLATVQVTASAEGDAVADATRFEAIP